MKTVEPVLDRFFLCAAQRRPVFTDFYDPASWTSFLDELKRQGDSVRVVAFGGAEDAERRMLGFFPLEVEEESFPIARLGARFNVKFNKSPRHQDYLGSIIGLGLERGKIGDIIVKEEGAELFVHEDIAEYICMQLEKVGRTPVSIELLPEDIEINKPPEKEEQINVASLRLDVVLAAMFRLSRASVKSLINAEKVFVNWSPCTDAGKQVKSGDMLTLRGYGRGRVGEILGSTKKGRLRLTVLR